MSLTLLLTLSVLDEQKQAMSKESNDLRQSLREVEKARLEARRELQELRRQVRHSFCCTVHSDHHGKSNGDISYDHREENIVPEKR